MENKAAIVNWHDDFNRNSWKLCLSEYGIKCLHEVPIDDEEVEITVYGPKENVARFLEDVDDGTCKPMQTLSRQFDDDEAYVAKLNELIDKFDVIAELEKNSPNRCLDESGIIELFGEDKSKEN